MIIYKITHKETGKIYIGQTTQSLTERLWQHSHRSPSQSHKSAIHNAFVKYGVNAFTIEQIDTADTLDNLNLLEIKYITQYNCLSPNGYNLLKGGDNKECHPETKAKISATLKGRPIKNRMNGAPKGRPVSMERRAQISAALKGRPRPDKYKPIIAVETGTVYESIQSAAKTLKINRVTLSRCLKTGQQHKKSGLTFKLCYSVIRRTYDTN